MLAGAVKGAHNTKLPHSIFKKKKKKKEAFFVSVNSKM